MRRSERRDGSVARQVLLLQVLVVVVLVVASLALATYDARRDARVAATDRAVGVARAVADSPALVAALRTEDPAVRIQPYAEEVRRDTDVDFVTVMALDRTRYSHPDPALIGRPFVGDLGDAPQGGILTQRYTGTLGPSMRAVVPVLDDTGTVVALVSVGITVQAIDQALGDDLVLIAVSAAAVLAVGLLGAWLVSRRLRRQTHGLGEREITRMYEYYSAVLHAVREGLLLIDADGRVQLVNDEARRLLGLPEPVAEGRRERDEVVGRSVHDLGLAPGLVAAALGRTAESDDLYLAGDRMLVVSSAPASWDGHEVGSVVSLRDHTELRSVTGELDAVRGLTESLRSQNHEAANRLHTVVSLIEMGRPEEAVDFATEELQVAQLLADRVVGATGDPVVAALLLGKTSEAVERGIELVITGEVRDGSEVPARDLVTVLGNLVDNAFDAVTSRPERRVHVDLRTDPSTNPSTDPSTGLGGRQREPDGGRLLVTVGDSGPGLDPDSAARVLERGWSTKASAGHGRGLGLALVSQVARRHHGEVTVGVSALGGAEFDVVLRLGSTAPPPAGAAPGPAPAAAPGTAEATP
ncbi:ATP-binding protein [Nocardioides sp. Leaf285]|uniref:ATP-binding protein n=1 Tax=Nocardioides sp. Leaf285 TaxID=1736322 RepID=UPI000B2045C7|nr:sensor histidine kinase [Nocardioides sp. Leaf285]